MLVILLSRERFVQVKYCGTWAGCYISGGHRRCGGRLAKESGVPAQRIGEIVEARRAISADTDLRLCRFFGLSKGYWLRAQAAYQTDLAEPALSKALAKIKPWKGSAA